MNNMKKIGWLILATIISKHAFAIGELKPPFTPTATYACTSLLVSNYLPSQFQ